MDSPCLEQSLSCQYVPRIVSSSPRSPHRHGLIIISAGGGSHSPSNRRLGGRCDAERHWDGIRVKNPSAFSQIANARCASGMASENLPPWRNSPTFLSSAAASFLLSNRRRAGVHWAHSRRRDDGLWRSARRRLHRCGGHRGAQGPGGDDMPVPIRFPPHSPPQSGAHLLPFDGDPQGRNQRRRRRRWRVTCWRRCATS
jgi:hypothetical protein